MKLDVWEFTAYASGTPFAVWVIFWGGAERLEGTFKSAFLIEGAAPFWSAAGIKIYVAISWLGALFWSLVN